MRQFREISIEPPKGALFDVPEVPEGMRAWRNPKNGFVVAACHYTADFKKRNNEWYSQACQNLRDDQIERELEINFDSRAGDKCFPYLEHNAGLYRLAPPNPIPAHWKIIVGLDYGTNNPTSIHFYAIDEFKRFWSYWEFYKPSNMVEISQVLQSHPDWHRVRAVIGDPVIFNKTQNQIVTKETGLPAYGTLMSIGEMLIKSGVYCLTRGNNDRLAGMERIRTLFGWRGHKDNSTPCLFISPNCPKQWWELNNLVFKPETSENKNPADDCVKRNDHAFDELKYASLSEDLPADVDNSKKYGQFSLSTIEEEIDESYSKENESDPFAINMRDTEELFMT